MGSGEALVWLRDRALNCLSLGRPAILSLVRPEILSLVRPEILSLVRRIIRVSQKYASKEKLVPSLAGRLEKCLKLAGGPIGK